MRRNYLFGKLLSVVLAAALALSPATTALAASTEDASIYGSSLEEFDEEDEASKDATDEKEETGDEAGKGVVIEEEKKDIEEDPEEGADKDGEKEPVEEAATQDSGEDEASENTSDAASEASSEEPIEEITDEKGLVGTVSAPAAFPGSAVAQGEAKSLGTNVEGQLFTWTAADGDHLGLYVYSSKTSGIDITSKVSSVFSDSYGNVTDLVIDDGIKVIGNNTFGGCNSLKEIKLPTSLQTIDQQAFYNCSSLESILIPKTVKSMGNDIFGGCTNLGTVSFEEGMAVIPSNALRIYAYGSKGYVSEVNIPSTVTTIEENAFRDQTSISKINFAGDRLVTIGSYAFSCTAIEGIDLASGVTTIENNAFGGCSSLKEIKLPASLQTIGQQAFYNCSSLESILIPKTVKSMGNDIFGGCTNLGTVSFEEGMAVIPSNALRIYAYGSKGYVSEVNIPSTVTKIEENAFRDQTSISKINFAGDRLVTIGSYAFSCTAIEGIDLASGVTTIENNAFGGCSSLKEIKLPASLQTIGQQAFYNCSSLESILIPKTVKSMGNDIFGGCTNLGTVSFEEGMTEIPSNALRIYAYGSKGYVSEVNIPSTVTKIEENAFRDQNHLTIVNLSSAIKHVEKNAFNGATALKEVYYAGNAASRKSIQIENGNDPLINATWKYLKGVTGVSLDMDSVLRYKEDITTGTKVTLKATVLPADASHLEVNVSKENIRGNAVSAVRVLNSTPNEWTIEATLTGETGVEKINVTTVEGGHTASCIITVKEKETARTPIFYINGVRASGTVEMTEGDRLSVGGTTVGSNTYYGTTSGSCTELLSDALAGGTDIIADTTIYAVSRKDGFKDSEETSIAVKYNAASAWGDITEEDRAEFGDDASKIPSGAWIPVHFLADTDLTYTGSKLVLGDLNVYYGNKLLSGKTDYTVSYKNNINAGLYTAENGPAVTVTLKGNYGKASKTFGFTIAPKAITDNETGFTTVAASESKDKNGSLKALKIDLKVKVVGKALKSGTDYDITYKKTGSSDTVSEIKEEGVYDAELIGKGNYSGTISFAKAVQVAGANSVKIGALTISKTSNKQILPDWDGEDQNVFGQNIRLSYKGTEVPESAYTVVMPTVTKAGKYTLTVAGSGSSFAIGEKNYYIIGSKNLKFTVTGSVAMNKVTIKMPAVTELTYSPVQEENELKGAVLTYNNKTLTEGKDYTVSYKNVNKAGTATVTFTGSGAFTGSAKKTYKINKLDISKLAVLNEDGDTWNNQAETYAYVKGGTKPVVSLTGIPESAYSLTYSNNKAKAAYSAGSAKNPSVKITGKGNYTGSQTVYFSVAESDISKLSMTVGDLVASTSPKKYAQTPVITDSNGTKLVAGVDFEKNYSYNYACDVDVAQKTGSGKKAVVRTVSRSAGDKVDDKDIIPAGTMIEMTVTGKGNYAGTVSETYVIARAKISALKFAVNYGDGRSSFVYTGKAIRPGKASIVVRTKTGSKWSVDENGSNYYDIVSYTNNVNRGTATITVKGKNGYAGTAKITFKITAR